MSTRAIADAVGIRQPSLFHHFDSKRAILTELLDRDLLPARERARYFAQLPGAAAPRIFAYMVADLRTLENWPYDVRSIYTTELLGDPDFIGQRRTYNELTDALRKLVDNALAGGEFRAVDAVHVQQAIGGMFLAAIWAPAMVTGAHLAGWPEQSAEIVLRGLLRDPKKFGQVKRAADELLREWPGGSSEGIGSASGSEISAQHGSSD
jgi:AcrR family transcriptional regulator